MQWLLDTVASYLLNPLRWILMGLTSSSVSKDIVQLIHEDHGRVRCLYRQYRLPSNTPQQKQLLALDMIRHSSFHSKREDMVLNPALQQCGIGSALMLSQHQHLEDLMQQLLDTPVSDPSFDALLHEYMTDTEAHLQEEERVLLPALAKQLSPQQLMDLGQQFEWAKLIAPSRPHPWTPKAPVLLSVLANTLLTPLDFARDLWAFSGAPTL